MTTEYSKDTIVELVGDVDRESIGKRGWIMALAVVATSTILGLASAPSAKANGTCETEIVQNYLKPLEGLPALRGIPVSNELPFGPPGLFVNTRGQSRLMSPGSGDIGYTVSSGRSSSRLNWLVSAKLARLDRNGNIRQVLGWNRKHVTSLGLNRSVPVRMPSLGEPGLYRLEIVFRNGSGTRLGRFGEYVRVLRQAGADSRLMLNRASFMPGEAVAARVEEAGTGWLEVRDAFSIEIYQDSAWTRAPISPKGLSLPIGNLIGPGEATSVSRLDTGAPCWSFTIPSGASPGLYRLVVEGESKRIFANRLKRGASLTLASEFQILPASG